MWGFESLRSQKFTQGFVLITAIKGVFVVNEGAITLSDVYIQNEKIILVDNDQKSHLKADRSINGKLQYLLPGVIDDQVHFREPGLTHKADIASESKAAVAGGVTSYMEMPNTIPQTINTELLEKKYQIAKKKSLANFSFYLGATNDNFDEIRKIDPTQVCGVKVFLGSSTGNMLVNQPKALEKIFSYRDILIAAHCEDENTIRTNMKIYKKRYGENVPIECHPMIRSKKACFKSSALAVSLAEKHDTRLHVIHLSTGKELTLFNENIPLEQKRITSEVCVHHLWFSDEDYAQKGAFIKWNPAIKTKQDRDALFQGLLKNKIDVIATDHAPHLKHEKENSYFQSPSGGPLVQHSLILMLEHYHNEKISLEKIVEKMCHAPATLFQIHKRGYIREGYFADLVLVDLSSSHKVQSENIHYKCGWSPFEGETFKSEVITTIVNGHIVYHKGKFDENKKGKRLEFTRTR